jgi:signal transduction histidine kinase
LADGFRIDESLARIGALTGEGLNREDFIREVLEQMLAMEFERARFWEVGEDISTDGRAVILVDRLPEDEPGPSPGYRRSWVESDVAKAGSRLDPVVSRIGKGASLSPLEEDLDLGGRNRVEIPVTAGDRTESILACDWRGPEALLSEADLRALRLLGSQIGSHLRLQSIGSGHRSTSGRSKRPDQAPAELVYRVARDLGEQLDAAITAVFAFSWPHQRLSKRAEFVAKPFRAAANREGELKEKYSAGGPALTGLAWQDPNFRQIISLPGLKKKFKIAIDKESLEWHTAVLGHLHTVQYAVVGTLEQRFLIRMMNRASRPELPFLREGQVLDAAIQDLRADVDAAIAMERLRSLQKISKLSAETHDLDGIVNSIGTALGAESIDNFVALCHQQASPQFSFVRGLGRCFGLRLDLSRRWQGDSLYREALDENAEVVVLSGHLGSSELATKLYERGFRAVLSHPMQAGQTEGVFLIGLEAVPPKGKGKLHELPVHLGYGTTALILAYSRLLANAVEMVRSHERVIGALRAYGLMGHEVRRPAGALGSAAHYAVMVSVEATDVLPDGEQKEDTVKVLGEKKEELAVAQRQLDSALQLGKLVARENEGTLQLRFAEAELWNVIRKATDEVALQVREDDLGWAPYFTQNEAAKTLGDLVCAEDYVGAALRNILLNAVKYSLPRRVQSRAGRQSVQVAVFGAPQESYVGIQVRNWGYAITQEQRDVIFDAWVRGGEEKGTDALAGMGLGLYLARRLIVAHGGEILCVSKPTSDRYYPKPDPHSTVGKGVPQDRPEPVVIHETTFEIRIPRNLEAGLHTHTWGPRYLKAKDVPIRDT